MKSVGIDIVSIKRIEKTLKKYKINFLKKVLTNNEINQLNNILNFNRKVEKLAGIYAAKEAIVKCLNGKIFLKDIEILYNDNGAPYCKANNYNFFISISHEKEYAIAIAILH